MCLRSRRPWEAAVCAECVSTPHGPWPVGWVHAPLATPPPLRTTTPILLVGSPGSCAQLQTSAGHSPEGGEVRGWWPQPGLVGTQVPGASAGPVWARQKQGVRGRLISERFHTAGGAASFWALSHLSCCKELTFDIALGVALAPAVLPRPRSGVEGLRASAADLGMPPLPP